MVQVADDRVPVLEHGSRGPARRCSRRWTPAAIPLCLQTVRDGQELFSDALRLSGTLRS